MKINLLPVHLTGLLAIVAASIGEGMTGGDAMVCLVQAVTAVTAAGVVAWRRRPTVGVIIAGWQSLGLFAMPFITDNLRSGHPGLVVSTIGYVTALAVSVGTGALEFIANRRIARTGSVAKS
jgi:hypothetical protein